MEPTEQNSRPRENQEPHGGAAHSELSEELERILALGEQSLDVVKSSAELFKLEFVLAVRSIPKAAASWLLMLPATLLVWLSFSALVAWATFEWSGQALVGFATLFALQLLSLFVLRWALKKYQRNMSFPYTTQSVQQFREELSNATAKKDSAPPP
ncbi:NfeD family protein [Gilvimarinus sp. DA14]|uniref:NfeD family protein n=1 Tax=Gilvimarinus sp. DA14 TaxID=2956798 RepID=UPI0020B76A91|nr:hypothetical protein [Gilvimarinus sp. DA14]UTF59764.1 hypothetical protein NHM04_15020 [Gilvimarinus sp. DA14]